MPSATPKCVRAPDADVAFACFACFAGLVTLLPLLQCTSACSVDVEEKLYKEAAGMGIACVTLSQRLALEEFHSQELRMGAKNDDGYELAAIEKPPASATPAP